MRRKRTIRMTFSCWNEVFSMVRLRRNGNMAIKSTRLEGLIRKARRLLSKAVQLTRRRMYSRAKKMKR